MAVLCATVLLAAISTWTHSGALLQQNRSAKGQTQQLFLEQAGAWPQRTEMLKTYRVEVHPPPPIEFPLHHVAGGSSSSGGGGDLTAQVNMVGFTDKGFGYMDYHNVRKGQKHFTDPEPKHKKAQQKSSTLRAQHQHSMHRQSRHQLAQVKKHLSREEREVDTLKGEVWALTSDVIPKMQREMSALRRRVQD